MGSQPFDVASSPQPAGVSCLFHVVVGSTNELFELISNLPVQEEQKGNEGLFISANTGARLLSSFALDSTSSNLLRVVKLVSGFYLINTKIGISFSWSMGEETAAKHQFMVAAV